MTYLRKRMIEDLQLRRMGALTQQRYVGAVQQLAGHYGKSPDRITEEELRDYFLYLKNVKKWARSTSAWPVEDENTPGSTSRSWR